MAQLIHLIDTRSAEILSALLAIVVALGMFTSPEAGLVVKTLHSVSMLPEWAIFSSLSAIFCLVASVWKNERMNAAARFVSGCMWGTIVLVFANAQLWLPFFWIALVMFAFDIYLVTIKGQLWSRSKS